MGGTWHSDYKENQKQQPVADVVDQTKEDASSKVDVDVANAEAPPMIQPPQPTEEEEERLRQKALMPKKHKRLLQRIEKSTKNKSNENELLMKKRKLNEGELKKTT